ncbi:MAG: multiple monosaccharide ABC transporter permease [Schaalia hyovaginalis]|uniref:multiple monosaccharide ABC transporter permease n=1 Tax=Schaalia hyovaginalis TaxID=29316 RepID=UPI0026EF7E49|nr:multiple monosaccharide ABC transporter permease [Schaalia hyovaginalis]MCI6557714.1 sugar ABC transporter permease [Schaalia hyovaginalis]MDD7553972.1 sugar ABC transporter permease [Schaalia hyovaginalis]MDY3093473.1 multiple monosaccharide ABC transporter permease [Schaalia hyovaginalis]MDY4263029.1 multiple monosaccharide ABC transporter permease [Schaalia hyovaginalis]MDY6213467.1 multiple monosaccharide ABC transporter permease [Schaalia hyovaginalis]
MSTTKSLGEMFKGNIRQSGIFLAFLAIAVLFAVLNPSFLSPGNLTNIVLQYSYILVLAIGMLFVILLGQIDLSVGSVVAVTGALSAVLVIKNGMPWWVGVIAAIVLGLIIGAWQGFWVAYVGIPGFIVTLAGMLLFRGLTFQVLENVSLSPFPKAYYNIANGFFNGLLGGMGFDVFTLVIFGIGVLGFAYQQFRSRKARIAYNQAVESMALFIGKIVVIAAFVMWFAFQLSRSRGLPFVLIILAVLVLIYGMLANSTVFGRDVYAIGGNISAAALSGINVKSVTFWTYVNMGFLSAVAGIIYSARMNGAQPSAGNMFELDAIAACFIGGASTTGGIGKLSGALVGGLIMAVMSNGMQLMGASTSTQQMVKGLVLLLAVAFDVWNKRRAG